MKKTTTKKPEEFPHSSEAEQGILGSIMIRPDEALPIAMSGVTEEDFFIPAHRTIFSTMVKMSQKGTKIDLITVTQALNDAGELDKVGGAISVTQLYTFVPTADNINYYIEIVRDKSTLRKLIETSKETIQRAMQEEDVDTILGESKLALGEIQRFNYVPPKTMMDHVEAKMERMEKGEANDDIIFTHIRELDRLSPIRKGDLPLIKGVTKAGKSIFALTIMENICVRNKLPGVIFSLEDRVSKVVDRVFAGVSRIPTERHHASVMSSEDKERASKALLKLSESNIIIYDDVFELGQIVSRAEQAAIDHPDLAIVVIDYAQLILTPNSKKSDSREREVASISRAFRRFAMKTGIPVVLLSQVNHNGVSRESQALEQDCTACLLVDFPAELSDEEKFMANERIIRVEFQRNGPSGVSFPMRFYGNLYRMENPSAADIAAAVSGI